MIVHVVIAVVLLIVALAAVFVVGAAARALILAYIRQPRHAVRAAAATTPPRRVFDRTEPPLWDKAQRDAAYAALSDGLLPRTEPVLAPLPTSTGRPVPDVLRPHPDGTCSICGDPRHAAAGHDMVMSILAARPEEPGWDVARLAGASLDDIAAAFDTSQFPAVTGA